MTKLCLIIFFQTKPLDQPTIQRYEKDAQKYNELRMYTYTIYIYIYIYIQFFFRHLLIPTIMNLKNDFQLFEARHMPKKKIFT